MFVFSMKARQLKAVAVAVIVFAAATIGGIYLVAKRQTLPVLAKTGYDLRAQNETQRLSFFSQFGWKIDPDSKEVKEVILPEKMDDVYTTYNQLQLQQGFDLMPYLGKRVKCWSYDVLNAVPSGEAQAPVRATILVYKGKVIAGDVASRALNGEMEPITRE